MKFPWNTNNKRLQIHNGVYEMFNFCMKCGIFLLFFLLCFFLHFYKYTIVCAVEWTALSHHQLTTVIFRYELHKMNYELNVFGSCCCCFFFSMKCLWNSFKFAFQMAKYAGVVVSIWKTNKFWKKLLLFHSKGSNDTEWRHNHFANKRNETKWNGSKLIKSINWIINIIKLNKYKRSNNQLIYW